MLNSFNSIILSIAVIILIIVLILVGMMMYYSSKNASYPPDIAECPDYWKMVKENNKFVCKNILNVNPKPKLPDYTWLPKWCFGNVSKPTTSDKNGWDKFRSKNNQYNPVDVYQKKCNSIDDCKAFVFRWTPQEDKNNNIKLGESPFYFTGKPSSYPSGKWGDNCHGFGVYEQTDSQKLCEKIDPFVLKNSNDKNTICDKYKWAKKCNVVWDGITNNNDNCIK